MSIARLMQLAASNTGGIDPAWDLAYAGVDPTIRTNSWDISTASFVRLFSVLAQHDTSPNGLFFKPDGLKMYIIGAINDNIYEYNLSTAWDISTASFLQLFSIVAQESSPSGLFFSPDGLKMYITGFGGDEVNEYSLSTAWDISTASFVRLFSVVARESIPTDLFFSSDGTKMYIIGASSRNVNEYNLSTPWNISTASFLQLFSVATQDTSPTGLSFKPDGTRMYIMGTVNDTVFEYELTTPWSVATAVLRNSVSVAAQDTEAQGIYFRPDGFKMYMIGATGVDVNEYNLGLVGNSFNVAPQDTDPAGLFFKPDGLKMYMIGTTGDDVNEYNLSTAWDISTASFLQLFSIVAQESSPSGLFFSPDGLKMYITGTTGDDVNEYNLSTAWDISTASFLQLFSVAAQEAVPTGLFFRPDGLKMYIIGSNGREVNEYNLSTAWDISTASFLQLFSVAAQDSSPRDLFFKPDGLKMYMLGATGDDVSEYNLSTAWDISTASYDFQRFVIVTQFLTPQGLFFKPDGLKMYIIGGNGSRQRVFEYNFTV